MGGIRMTNPFIIPIFKEKSGVVFSEIQTKCDGGALWWGTPEFSSRILGGKSINLMLSEETSKPTSIAFIKHCI